MFLDIMAVKKGNHTEENEKDEQETAEDGTKSASEHWHP